MGFFSEPPEADKLEAEMAKKGARQRPHNYKAPWLFGGDRCTDCNIEKRYHRYVPKKAEPEKPKGFWDW